jgi:hypothetical protein
MLQIESYWQSFKLNSVDTPAKIFFRIQSRRAWKTAPTASTVTRDPGVVHVCRILRPVTIRLNAWNEIDLLIHLL